MHNEVESEELGRVVGTKYMGTVEISFNATFHTPLGREFVE